MPTFTGRTKIKRAVADPGTDDTLPTSGLLSWRGINGTSGLAGTTGIDCAIVHGDQWSQTDGDHTQTVNMNRKESVGVNQTIMIGGDQKETICGTANETIIGPHIITNMNVYNETRLLPHIQTHGDNDWYNNAVNYFHSHGAELSIVNNLVEAEIDHYEVAAGHFEAKGQHNYFSVNDNNAVLVQFQMKPLNVKVDTTEAEINGLKCEVMSLGARCGFLESDVVGLKANGGASLGPNDII